MMRPLFRTFVLLAGIVPLLGAAPPARKPVPGFPVRPGIWRLHGIEPTLPTDDLEPLRGMIGNAPVVGLGESFHTSGGFYVLKHRIFRFLVEQMGFRAFAIESSWTGADDAARYVETCEGAPERAIARHVNVWQSTEYADLVQWMCEWNRDHPDPADKLSLFGFDVQQPQEDAQNLIGFLRQLAAEEDHPWISGMRSCEGVTASHPFGEVPQDSHDRCLQALSAVEKHVERNRDVLLRRFTEQDLALVLLHLVGLRAWEEQVFRIAHDFAAGYSARDAGMAYAFLTLRAMRAPEARTVIWAANSHLARNRLPNGASPLGSHLAAALGRGYVSFALTAYETEIDFPGFGCGPVAPLPGSVESRLHALGEDALLMDLSRSPFLRSGLYPMGIDRLRPRKDYNGLIYLERSDRMHPLVWEPCR